MISRLISLQTWDIYKRETYGADKKEANGDVGLETGMNGHKGGDDFQLSYLTPGKKGLENGGIKSDENGHANGGFISDEKENGNLNDDNVL